MQGLGIQFTCKVVSCIECNNPHSSLALLFLLLPLGLRCSGSNSQPTQHIHWQNKKTHVSIHSSNSCDELGHGPYPLRPHSLSEKSVLFRTMLKQVADMLMPEDVESLAYIHSVQKMGKGEAVTALSLFRELEAKGVFSADNVEPLEEVLGGINRLDVANTVVKDFKAKLKGEERGRPNEESTASAGGKEVKGGRPGN